MDAHRTITPALIASLALLAPHAAAQTSAPRRVKPPAATSPVSPQTPANAGQGEEPLEFSDVPLKLPTVGLSISCPVGVLSQTDSAGRDSAIVLVPKDTTWSLKVRTPRTTDVDATIEHVADTTLTALFEAYGINAGAAAQASASGKLIREPAPGEKLTVAGRDAARWFIELPSLEGKEPQVRGFSVVRCTPGQFVVFELLTTKTSFAKARRIADRIIATTMIEDPSVIQAERASAIAAGVKLIESVDATSLRGLVEAFPVRWERRFVPGADGSTRNAHEVAYRRIKFMYGPRSLLDNQGGTVKASGNRTEGFIVQVDARILGPDKSVTDSCSIYFMSPDRAEETWTVTNAHRASPGASPQVVTETGARNGQSMVVRTEGKGVPAASHKPILQGEGYLCQVEAMMLPFVMMRSGTEIGHGFYVWNSLETKVVLRKDTLKSTALDGGERGWQISTEMVEGRKPSLATFNAAKRLVRIDMPDGSIWEPTSYEELRQIWESKGLPTN
ncbi:MAG: hypothetical protein WCK33_08370 [Phycisphaerae bacterium]|jgi:hypothetical protein